MLISASRVARYAEKMKVSQQIEVWLVGREMNGAQATRVFALALAMSRLVGIDGADSASVNGHRRRHGQTYRPPPSAVPLRLLRTITVGGPRA